MEKFKKYLMEWKSKRVGVNIHKDEHMIERFARALWDERSLPYYESFTLEAQDFSDLAKNKEQTLEILKRIAEKEKKYRNK